VLYIKELIRNELDNNLIYQIDLVFDNVKYIMIDWTWITKKICLIIYYDYINKKVIHFWFYDAERYEYIENDLEWLNWVLDGHIFSHRWLRIDRLISFVSLWLYERNL